MLKEQSTSRSNLRTLGCEEAILVLEMTSDRTTGFTAKDAARLLPGNGKAYRALRRLVAKGWAQRTRNGRYVLLPPEWGSERIEDFDLFVLASASVETGYVGWWSAASRHGFTTQVPHVLHVAGTQQVAGRDIQGAPVRYVRLSPRKFFGWTEMLSMSRPFRISTPEKTVIDCIDRPDLCGGPTELAVIVGRAASRLDAGALVDVALRMESVSVCQRLGYLLDATAPGFLSGEARSRLRDRIPASARSVFGRASHDQHDVGYVHAWGLFVHARIEDLMAEIPYWTSSPQISGKSPVRNGAL